MSKIIYRGALTEEKLKILADQHLRPIFSFQTNGDDHIFNPAKNHNAISIIKQPDGNYAGSMWKGDQVITAREIGPEYVLQKLLTHE